MKEWFMFITLCVGGIVFLNSFDTRAGGWDEYDEAKHYEDFYKRCIKKQANIFPPKDADDIAFIRQICAESTQEYLKATRD